MTGPARSHAPALAEFFAGVSPALLEDLRASGALAGAEPAVTEREWLAVALHACIRGVVADGGHGDETADLVDAFHDQVLASLAPPAEQSEWRARLAERYAEYDGVTRTLGQKGAPLVPAAIARSCARHVGAADARALAETLTPLLEALAEGAAAALAQRSEVALPPVEGLRRITGRLDSAGVVWAVGASGLLASLGLVSEVNDWDVQVDEDPTRVRALLADLPHSFHGHGGCHADWKLAFEAERTELIPRFAFFVSGGVVRVPLHVVAQWQGLPMASPEGWACAYWLMGRSDVPALRERRNERAELLFAWLAKHGADATRVAELLGEPLPAELSARLAATPTAGV